MGYEKKEFMSKDNEEKYVPKETVKDVLDYPFRGSKERGVRKEICEKFNVHAAVSQTDGKTVEAFYFPSYNQKGTLTGFKKQNLLLDKGEKGHWTTVGVVSVGNKLFAQQQAEEIPRKRGALTVNEGEWDTLSTIQACIDNVKGTKFEGMEPFVVSLPLGTGAAVESILHNNEFVSSFSDLQLMLDDDYCTPSEKAKNIMKGQEAREAIASALIGSGINLYTIIPPAGFKDASDMLQADKSAELAKLVQFGRKAYVAEKILKAGDVTFEDIVGQRPLGIMVPEFPKLMNQIKGFRTRELTLLCAPSNVGKSTISALFANAFMSAGERVGMFYLEERPVETMQRMIASQLRVNYLTFKNDPTSVASREDIQRVYDDIVDNNRVVMLDHFGSLPLSEFMAKVKHAHFVEGCRYLIVDHVTVLTSPDVGDERKELDMTMTTLAAFCAANDICVILISHINRSNAANFQPPKGKEDQPFWVRVTKESLRGSSSLESLSWNILALEPEILPNRERGRCRIVTLKNRTWSYLGVADAFRLDNETWDVITDEDEVLEF